MPLLKPALSLRKKSHLGIRLDLREERMSRYVLFRWFGPVYVAFALVDKVCAPEGSLLLFLGVKLAAVLASRYLYLLSRGRVSYQFRYLFSLFPYALSTEYVI